MNRMEGGCLCGDVRYLCTTEPVVVALCHCTHCQRQSGSAFSVNVGVPKGSLQLVSGSTQVYPDIGHSGQPVYRHFCGRCGSPIFSDVVSRPGLDWLKAGTLDDSTGIHPTLSLWCDSAQDWFSHPEGMTMFAQGPTPL